MYSERVELPATIIHFGINRYTARHPIAAAHTCMRMERDPHPSAMAEWCFNMVVAITPYSKTGVEMQPCWHDGGVALAQSPSSSSHRTKAAKASPWAHHCAQLRCGLKYAAPAQYTCVVPLNMEFRWCMRTHTSSAIIYSPLNEVCVPLTDCVCVHHLPSGYRRARA